LNSLPCSRSRFRVHSFKFASCLSFANNCSGCAEKTVRSYELFFITVSATREFPP